MKFKLNFNLKEKFFHFFEEFEIKIKNFINEKMQFIYKFDYREVLKFLVYLISIMLIAFVIAKFLVFIHFEIITFIITTILLIFTMFLIYANDWIINNYSIENYASLLRISVFISYFLLIVFTFIYIIKI